jgi:hypothetical protein
VGAEGGTGGTGGSGEAGGGVNGGGGGGGGVASEGAGGLGSDGFGGSFIEIFDLVRRVIHRQAARERLGGSFYDAARAILRFEQELA